MLRHLTVCGAGALSLVSIAVFSAYLRLVRPWQLRWGATDDEVARRPLGLRQYGRG